MTAADQDAHKLERAIEIYTAWHRDGAREPVDVVLARHPDLAELLEAMLGDRATIETAAEADERRLGDYTLLRERGRGGMGVVYEAVDRRLGRRVALKVLPAHLTLQQQAVARFKREALAAARLDDPGIVKVFDVGSDGDTHWFAMELIEGRSLAEQRTPPVRRAVDWIRAVAESLQHAHEQGILHRDLKPSNILLRGNGTPVLTDFGLAREVSMPSLTMTGGFLGTPNYVSPEQARGDALDARSDVFSLGATLYELCTGTKPFDAPDPQRVLHRVVHDDPRNPAAMRPSIDEDLAAVILRALEKSPDDRYASAGDLAADLAAWLERRPVSARPISQWTRTLRWVRREPLRATLAVVLAFAVPTIAGLIGHRIAYGPILAAGLEQERAQLVEAKLADGFFALGEERWTEAMRVLREARDLAPTHVEAVIGYAYALSGIGETKGAVDELDAAIARADQPALRRAKVKALLADGRLQEAAALEKELGEPQTALEFFVEGVRRYESARRQDDREGLREATAWFSRAARCSERARPLIYYRLAQAAWRADERVVARETREAIATLWPDAKLGEVRIAAILVDEDPVKAIPIYERLAADETDPDRAMHWFNLGLAREKTRDADGALSAFRTAILIEPDYARAHLHCGMILQQRGKHDDAIEAFRAAIEADPKFVRPYNNLGISLRRLGRLEEAALSYERAIQAKPDYAQPHYNLGLVRSQQGRHEDAAASYRAAIAIDPRYLQAHGNLGEVLLTLGNAKDAATHFRRAIQLAPRDAEPRRGLGRALGVLGDHKAARRELELAVALEPTMAEGWAALAWCLVDPASPTDVRDPSYAIVAARRADALVEGGDPASQHVVAEAMRQLGDRAGAETALAHCEKTIRLKRVTVAAGLAARIEATKTALTAGG
jgi:tetratricopeptide (TPR) repeat protein